MCSVHIKVHSRPATSVDYRLAKHLCHRASCVRDRGHKAPYALYNRFQLISAKGAAFVPWQPIELSDLLRFSALLTVKVCDLPLPHESR